MVYVANHVCFLCLHCRMSRYDPDELIWTGACLLIPCLGLAMGEEIRLEKYVLKRRTELSKPDSWIHPQKLQSSCWVQLNSTDQLAADVLKRSVIPQQIIKPWSWLLSGACTSMWPEPSLQFRLLHLTHAMDMSSTLSTPASIHNLSGKGDKSPATTLF